MIKRRHDEEPERTTAEHTIMRTNLAKEIISKVTRVQQILETDPASVEIMISRQGSRGRNFQTLPLPKL